MSNPRTRVALVVLTATLAAAASGCGHGRPSVPAGMTLAAGAPTRPLATLVWLGRGAAERLIDGVWRRVPTFDYEFSVEQHRWADHWESVKTLRRTDPAYDGSAGPRVQVLFFRIELGPRGLGVDYRIQSTLGDGVGHADPEFREAVIELRADVSRFAPFDRYRITQHYRYEQGTLDEVVELADGDRPWVRNLEQARLFAPTAVAAIAPPSS